MLGPALFGHVQSLNAQPRCYTPEEAAGHAGEHACVSGRVTNVFWAQQSTGRPTFVDMGTRFTIVIWEENRPSFEPPPEAWRGATFTIWGVIEIYRGKAQIILRSPVQFAPPATARPAATPAPVTPRVAPPAPAPVQVATPAPAPPQPAPTSTPIPQQTPDPTPEPTPDPTPLPFGPGTPVAQARVIATPVLEGPVDVQPPLERPRTDDGTPTVLIAGALALVVLGVGGSFLAARRRS
jgi:hypothetical protein